ncbi:MAG: Ppx/GppA family phosphatase [Actinobacteria bacterium]|nr:Ppx/GppA family phosphatase [Actinomycetota bacterium]MSW24168.1 Ppx/GppA family phosphatase [Actinomycetota bacterium]MSX28823.1 Ppx/GppA family phosphatase [Actinomycetota bacterium]MSX42768.1 Ppx/GppA family phosphatase [Actinomycetota bacterium]MSX96987.1 Ppx/GppA family phosphatase [Actinomycetota bacterium]
MRLGVLDVGSNTVHLLIVDAHAGAAPIPAMSQKYELRLSEQLKDDGSLKKSSVKSLIDVLHECNTFIADHDCDELLAFATSAIRESSNSDETLKKIKQETGIELQVLDGEHEAVLTFLAVRRWFGWSSGRLLVADIGGGSLEVAMGSDEHPELAKSTPLGAGRLTRDFFGSEVPDADEIKALRKYVQKTLVTDFADLIQGDFDHAVATSKTFKQLARLSGAAPSSEGQRVQRNLTLLGLDEWVPKLTGMTVAQRAQLPGVSAGRAEQLLAGAIVAQETMKFFNLTSLEICPWALREGIILRRLDWFADDSE